MFNRLTDATKQLIDGLSRAISRVLVVGWLWIPALYSLLFFLVLMMGKQDFKSNKEFFLIGFFVCVAASIVMVVLKGPNFKKPSKNLPAKVDDDKAHKKHMPIVNPPNNTTNNHQYIVLQNAQPLQQTFDEAPLVFASRVDPNLFIYEYHDRLLFFKKDNKGMLYLGTEFKKQAT